MVHKRMGEDKLKRAYIFQLTLPLIKGERFENF